MSFIVDDPERIEGYRLLATLHGLKMEVEIPAKHPGMGGPQSLPTRGMALASARRILAQYNVSGPGKNGQWRTRKQALAGMQQLCFDLGITNKEEAQ